MLQTGHSGRPFDPQLAVENLSDSKAVLINCGLKILFEAKSANSVPAEGLE
jgi:hypothetical protein